MMIAVFLLGLAVSAWILIDDIRRRRAPVPHVRRLSPEVHLVAAMIAGAGAGLAWGSVWGLAVFVLQAFGGMIASLKLRA